MPLLANITVVLFVAGIVAGAGVMFIAAEVSRGKFGLATMRYVGLPLLAGGALMVIVAVVLAILQKGS